MGQHSAEKWVTLLGCFGPPLPHRAAYHLDLLGIKLERDETMKQTLLERNNEITISAGDLECANLAGFDCLELHLLNQAAVVIPGEMTAGELIAVGASLLKLATILVDGLLVSCSGCDNCGQEDPCELMGEHAMSEEPDSKGAEPFDVNSTGEFTDIVDPLDFEDQAAAFDNKYDLSDISPDMLKLLQESGVCMLNLKEKLNDDLLVYFNGKIVDKYDSEKM